MSANERRAEIMRIMVARRQENMQVLAAELGVTDRTIRNDILVLTAEYPLETTRGNGGGVRIADWYHPHKNIFSQDQISVLEQMMNRKKCLTRCSVNTALTSIVLQSRTGR